MLLKAVKRLGEHPQIDAIRHSSWHETPPIGGPADQGPYLNGAARVETSLDPQALLRTLAGIETSLGRQRTERWGSRTIDLDLLLYDRLVCRTPLLTIPHPRMAWRRFVLRPAVEVAASMLHPTTGWTVSRLLDHLDSALPYVAITGPVAAGKTRLAERLVQGASARLISEPAHRDIADTFHAYRSGNAWAVQLEFLEDRVRLLGKDLPGWNDPKSTWVSEFWFGQSLAYAEVWLSPPQFDLFCPIWEDARSRVIGPKLTVLLDVATDRVVRRIRRRGWPEADGLMPERLETIRRALLRLVDRPGHGPVMWLADEDEDRIFAEVLAAVEAMNA
jgi:2-amino-4-hydroxy-6-hydroxymethyldihydropteridine diphosphokinase